MKFKQLAITLLTTVILSVVCVLIYSPQIKKSCFNNNFGDCVSIETDIFIISMIVLSLLLAFVSISFLKISNKMQKVSVYLFAISAALFIFIGFYSTSEYSSILSECRTFLGDKKSPTQFPQCQFYNDEFFEGLKFYFPYVLIYILNLIIYIPFVSEPSKKSQ